MCPLHATAHNSDLLAREDRHHLYDRLKAYRIQINSVTCPQECASVSFYFRLGLGANLDENLIM